MSIELAKCVTILQAAIRDPKLLTHKLELYPGYVTSIRQHEEQVLLNVEISHKVDDSYNLAAVCYLSNVTLNHLQPNFLVIKMVDALF